MNRKERRTLARKSKGSKIAAKAESVTQAIQLQQRGQLDEADVLYRKILRHDPQQVDALHFLGVLEAQRGRHQQAVDLIRRALALNPHYADAWNNLGNVFAAMNQPDEAATVYQKAAELAPNNASAHCNLGAMLRRTGKYQEAEAACRQAIALNPQLIEAHFNLGKVLTTQNHHEEAVTSYQETIRLNPSYTPAYRALGILLYRMGRSEDAVNLYRNWLEHDPDNLAAKYMLAAHSGRDVPDRAMDHYVQDLFDEMADQFDEHLGRLDYQAPNLIAQKLAHIIEAPERPLTVLDAGCGTGLCGVFLRSYAHNLVGVDLSPRMVERARERNDYDDLHVAELTAFLHEHSTAYDLIVSADTLVYFGNLEPVLTAAICALRVGGWFVFTTERCTESTTQNFRLEPSGRYSHSQSYLSQVLTQAGMDIEAIENVDLRIEGGQAVGGFLVSARKLNQTPMASS